MYAWIWRHLPGPWPLRLVIALIVLAGVVWSLFSWVFPWAEDAFNINDITVE